MYVIWISFNYFNMQGHKIYAMVGWELFNKFVLCLKQEAVYIMYNFRDIIDEIQEFMTNIYHWKIQKYEIDICH